MNITGILVPLLVSFSQSVFSLEREYNITGEMLVTPGNNVYLNIIEPVNQKMLITLDSTIIYYPDEKRAFNIFHKRSEINLQNIPQVEPLNSDYYDQLGFNKIKERVIDDTTVVQFLSTVEKNNPSLITQKLINSKTSQIIIATSLGAPNYTQINFHEYATFEEREYIKNYSVSLFRNGILVSKNSYLMTKLKHASKDDAKRLKFVIPPEINIELKSFN